MTGDRYQVSAIKVTVTPPLKFPAQGPNAMQNHDPGVGPYSPVDDFTAQAPSESVRGPKFIGKRKLRAYESNKIIGKRKLRASEGPKVVENVSSERPMAQKHLKT